ANVTPFKGLECDAGTAFEVGFAYALGIRTYLYSGFDQSIQRRHERLQHALEAVEAVAPFFDFARFEAEDLGAGVNLMLLEAAEETGGVFVASHAEAADDLEVFRMAVARLARDLG
ncbi:MAG: nucleoside 2-deoxyribosyltransferase, partial [Pseudomonadota bacterium]